MLCYVVLAVTVKLAVAFPQPYYVLRQNLTPEEAQKYLKRPPFTQPMLSDYESSQFHGQDGLGAYAYGYKNPQSAKVEERERSGNLEGAYTWSPGPNQQLIKVHYWQDSEGFHQEDNLPKDQPPRESEAVTRARLAHEKAWQKAAGVSRGEYYPNYDYQGTTAERAQASYLQYLEEVGLQPTASEQQGVYVQPSQGQRGSLNAFSYPDFMKQGYQGNQGYRENQDYQGKLNYNI